MSIMTLIMGAIMLKFTMELGGTRKVINQIWMVNIIMATIPLMRMELIGKVLKGFITRWRQVKWNYDHLYR